MFFEFDLFAGSFPKENMKKDNRNTSTVVRNGVLCSPVTGRNDPLWWACSMYIFFKRVGSTTTYTTMGTQNLHFQRLKFMTHIVRA